MFDFWYLLLSLVVECLLCWTVWLRVVAGGMFCVVGFGWWFCFGVALRSWLCIACCGLFCFVLFAVILDLLFAVGVILTL